uniref:radical SAM/SPASM domain-containing protein n=1 Tax=Prevotella sp. TaxID=59823 RepID=UPI00402781B6
MMIDRCYIEITNTCNLDCHFCPKHHRKRRQLSEEEFDLLTDRVRGKVCFLYFHLMGEPLLHPLLPQFITMAREKGFKTVLTSNGTLLHRAMALLDTLPHKIQLSLHSHESNARGELSEYMDQVMRFSTQAAGKGTCMVLRLWNQGGMDRENEEVMRLIEKYVPKPWKERPDGFRLCDNLYLEFDRKFEWPGGGGKAASDDSDGKQEESDGKLEASPSKSKQEYFCKALIKQIGVLSDGSLVPCCLDHDGNVILGNLFHQSLEEILASPRAQALVEGFRHHAATEPLCQSCESALVNKSFRGKKRK